MRKLIATFAILGGLALSTVTPALADSHHRRYHRHYRRHHHVTVVYHR
jgi:hypothetical protein